MSRRFLASLLCFAILLSQAAFSPGVALADEEKAGAERRPDPPRQEERSSFHVQSFTPYDGHVTHLLGGGGVHLRAAFASPQPVTAIEFAYSADGTNWQPISGEQDSGVQQLTGRLAYQRSMRWDASAVPDGEYQLRVVGAAGDKTAEEIHKLTIDRKSVVPDVKPAAAPARPEKAKPNMGTHEPQQETRGSQAGGRSVSNLSAGALATLPEPIVMDWIGPVEPDESSFLSEGWAGVEYVSDAQISSIVIEYRLEGVTTWTAVTPTYDSGVSSQENEDDGVWSSNRYVDFDVAGFAAGTYQLRFTATDVEGHTRSDFTSFEVGPIALDYLGPDDNEWYGPDDVGYLWIEADFDSAQEPQSIVFQYRKAGEAAWSDLTLSDDTGLRKSGGDGDPWYSWRYVQWDASAWEDGAYEVQYTFTDVAGGTYSGMLVYNIDQTSPEASALTVVTGPDGESFDLSWTGPAGVTEYRVERYAPYGYNDYDWGDGDGGGLPTVAAIGGEGYWIDIAFLDGDTTSFTDTQVARGVEYTYRVWSRDLASNESPASNEVPVSLPYTGPVLDYLDPADEYENDDWIDVEAQFRDDVEITSITFEYSTDNAVWQAIPLQDGGDDSEGEVYWAWGNWDVSALPDGVYYLRVTALDAGGRPTSETAPFTLDRELTISGLAVAVNPDGGLMLSWEAISDASYYYLSAYRDGSYYRSEYIDGRSNSFPDYWATIDRTYQYVLDAYDQAGNWAQAEVTYEWYLGPAVALIGGNPAYTNQATYLVSGQTEPGAAVTVGGTTVALDAEGRFSHEVAVAEGTNNVVVEATNAVGTRTINLAVIMDTTPPTYFSMSPSDGTRVGASLEIFGESYDEHGLTRMAFQFRREGETDWATIDETTYTPPSGGYRWKSIVLDANQPLPDGRPLGEGAHTWRLEVQDVFGNVGHSPERSLVVDLTGPAAPTELTAAAGVRSVNLAWGASPDTDVRYYKLYRATSPGGPYELIATRGIYWWENTSRTHLDLNVQGGTTYYYIVRTQDTLGNEGHDSLEVSAAPAADAAPPVITGHSPWDGSTIQGPAYRLYVYFNDDDGALVQSVVFEWSSDDGGTWNTMPNTIGPQVNYGNEEYAYVDWATAALSSGTYKVRATTTDRSGNTASSTVTYTTDFDASVPANLTASVGHGGAVQLSWDPVGDADHWAYEILRRTTPGGSYTHIGTVYDTNISFTDTNVDEGSTYYYVVRSVDDWSNRSDLSNEVQAVADADTLAPTVSSVSMDPLYGETTGSADIGFTFYITDNVQKGLSAVTLEYSTDDGATWTPLTFDGPHHNGGTTYYLSGTWYTAGLSEGPVTVKVTATDNAGNTSVWTHDYTLDLATEAVTNVEAFPGQNNVQLRWTPVEDENFSYYQILRKSSPTGSFSHLTYLYSRTQEGYLNSFLTPGTTYYYVIDTYDRYGNVARSQEVSATPQVDTTPPEITSVSPANDAAIGESQNFVVYFTDNADPSLVTGTMEYSTDGTNWTLVGSMTYDYWYSRYLYRNWDISALPDGDYQVRFTIKDGNNNTDEEIVTYHLDHTAPAAVSLTAEGLDVNHIRLTWTASDPDVQTYRIQRAEAAEGPFSDLTITDGDTLTYDNVVTPNITYYYRVIPRDRFRDGPLSNVASAMAVQDAEPPQVTNLTPANGRQPGSFNIVANSTDNLGVASIRLEYSTDGGATWTEMATNNNVSISYTWDNSTVPEGEVLVRAAALDAAGNSSASRADNPVRTYTLDRTAPAAPVIAASAPDERHIKLDWSFADSDVEYVRLEWASAPEGPWNGLGSFYPPTQTYTHSVTPATAYYYRAAAFDGLHHGPFSEPLAATSEPDSKKPTVSYLTPSDGTKPGVFKVQAGATDNLGVTRIALEYSLDGGSTWSEFAAANAHAISHDWDTVGLLPSGSTVKVRAVARDGAGNTSDNSPIRTYTVDNDAPSAPMNLATTVDSTRIIVTWDLPPLEEGVRSFNLYRSTDGTNYSLHRSGIAATGFDDIWIEQGFTYHYVATAVDAAGNESPRSLAVSATPLPDNQAPAIISVNPGGGTVGANPSIWVSAQDNYRLQSISLAYRPGTSGDWTEISTAARNGRTDGASFAWDTTGLTDGSYQLRALATDQAGNASSEFLFSLTLDLTPPPAPVITATPGGWSVQLDWTAVSAPDLYGYRLLKQRPDGSWATLGATGALSHTDEPLDPAATYTYAVEAVDQRGNAARSAPVSAQPLADDPFAPTAYAGSDSTVYVGTEVTLDGTGSRDNDQVASYSWAFPDGSTETGAVVSKLLSDPGTYTIVLTATDAAGNADSDSVTINVKPQPVVGNLTVVVKDEATGSRIGGASVVIQIPGGDLLHYTSNGSGEVNLVAPPGDYTAHAYKTGYLPDNTEIAVTEGSGGTYEVLLEPGEIVTGELTVERMTLDQIVEAGIDVTAPENQWVYKFEIHLAFQNTPVPPQTVIVNHEGDLFTPLPPIGIGGGGGGDGGTEMAEFIAYPQIIPSPVPEVEPTIAYLVVPGKASFLKEFFEVQLRLMNNAAEQYVIDNAEATLNLPEGIALAPTAQPQSLTVDLNQLAGQEEKVVKWVIRGDEEGDYNLSADFTGTLLPFNEPVSGHFTTSKPFHVWGPSAVKLIVEPQQTSTKGAPYHLRLSMQNVTDQPLPGGGFDPAHVYNAAIELLEGGKQNFIYAPNQQLLQMHADLEPGETFSVDYFLIPCIDGDLVLDQSYMLRTGGNAEFESEILPGHAAPYPGLTLTATRSGSEVTLQWDGVSGAVAYRIYTVRPDLLMSTAADRVAEVTETSVTLTETGGPQAYIVTVVGADGSETLQHKVSDVNWCDGAALPVVTVDPGEVRVGQESTVLITANAGGLPVADGTVSVGTYATDVPLDDNGQASVTFTPTAVGPIEVIVYRAGTELVRTSIQAVGDDIVPPYTNVETTTEVPGENGWYYGPGTVTLTAADNEGGSGVASIWYSVDGAEFQAYTGPVVITDEGIHEVQYYAIDAAGNPETPAKSTTVKIDLYAPTTQATFVAGSLTLTATDSGSGVAETEYRFEGDATWQPYTTPVTVPEGVARIEFRSTDVAGRTEAPKSIAEGEDIIPPITTAQIDGTLGENGWYITPATITLTATDNEGGSGVAEIRYSFDGTSFSPYSAPVVVEEEGPFTVHYHAVDVAGNEESVKTAQAQLDLAAPVTTALLSGSMLTLSATDSASGVAGTEFTFDGGATWQPYSEPVTVPEGVTEIQFRSTDVAGHSEAPKAIRVPDEGEDTIPPATTAQIDGTQGENGWYITPVTIMLTAEDNPGGSGVAEIRYSLDGASFSPYAAPILIEEEGPFTVHYYAIDLAGNEEAVKTAEVQLDLAAPVTEATLEGRLLTLTAVDSASGVAATEYSFDGGATWQPYTEPVSVPEAVSTVHYRSTDQAGNEEDPASITLTPPDAEAPAAPAGLLVGAASTVANLSWLPSPEPDLDHYVVYRFQEGGEPAILARVEASQDPRYDDRSVTAGLTYCYSVTAVDKAGNESEPSEAVCRAVPLPPTGPGKPKTKP